MPREPRPGNYLADRLVTEDSGKWSWNVSECFVHVGIADAACVHLHQHLIRPGLRLGNIFDLPRTAYSGYDRSFQLPPSAIRCKHLCDRRTIPDLRPVAPRIASLPWFVGCRSPLLGDSQTEHRHKARGPLSYEHVAIRCLPAGDNRNVNQVERLRHSRSNRHLLRCRALGREFRSSKWLYLRLLLLLRLPEVVLYLHL